MQDLVELYFAPKNPEAVDLFPPLLFKFRDWQNPIHKRTLTNNELYIPNAISLNDPF